MKTFLRKILIFMLVPAAVMLLWLICDFYAGTRAASLIRQASQHEVLLMGDSQIQRLNPELFPVPAFNFATSAEHYYFTFQKLSAIADGRDCRVKTVVLGLSAHSFAPVYSRLFDPETSEGRQSVRYFRHYISDDGFLKARHLADIEILRSVVFAWPERGGHRNSVASHPDTATLQRISEMHYGGPDTLPCATQHQWLDSIVALCRKSDIRLVLLSTPYHPWYQQHIAPQYFQALDGALARTGNQAEYISFLSPPVSPSLMSDANHLNTAGATHYTRLLTDTLFR